MFTPTTAQAQVQFATFAETDTVANGSVAKGVTFTNTPNVGFPGASGTLLVSSNATFALTFEGTLSSLGTFNTSLTLAGTTTDTATTGSGYNFQSFSSSPIVFTFKGLATGNIVLSGTIQTAGGSGDGITIGKNATQANAGFDTSSGDIVTFTSPYLNFANVTEEATTFSFNPLTPKSGNLNADGLINSFSATFGGNFSSTPPPILAGSSVPEPASLILVTLGLISLPVVARQRKSMMTKIHAGCRPNG